MGMGTPAQGRWGQLWGHWEQCHKRLPATCCALWSRRPPGRVHPLPAKRAAQAAVTGAAPQAAGAEVVVAVEQAGVLVGLMAEQADQWVAVGLLQLRAAPQRGEDAAGHLWGRERPPPRRASPPVPSEPCFTRALWLLWKGRLLSPGPASCRLFLGYEQCGMRLPRTHPFPQPCGLGAARPGGMAPTVGCPPMWVPPEQEHPLGWGVPCKGASPAQSVPQNKGGGCSRAWCLPGGSITHNGVSPALG